MNVDATAAAPERLYALVPCAGLGLRAQAGGPKQYAEVAGRAVVAHTVQALLDVAALDGVLVVLSPQDDAFEAHVPGLDGGRGWAARVGGATRASSVAQGLQALQSRGARDADWVLVHDAARALLRPAWVQRLIDACLGDAVGGLLALPLSDTLKQASDDVAADPAARSARSLDRSGKWLAQTPQMFRIGTLQRALAQASDAVTDEASAIEALGLRPLLIPGEAENFKLTWPADFALAERLLRTR
jgi:2-C-methyl-D-erythritol 4-phosphate cytidylyltransferase